MKLINYNKYNKSFHNVFKHTKINVFDPRPITNKEIDNISFYIQQYIIIMYPKLVYDTCYLISRYLLNEADDFILSIINQLKLYHSYECLLLLLDKCYIDKILHIISKSMLINIILLEPLYAPWYHGVSNVNFTIISANEKLYTKSFIIFTKLYHVLYHNNTQYLEHLKYIFTADNYFIKEININNIAPTINLKTICKQIYSNNLSFKVNDIINHDLDDITSINKSIDNNNPIFSYNTFMMYFLDKDDKDIWTPIKTNISLKQYLLQVINMCIHLNAIIILIHKNNYYNIEMPKATYNIIIGEICDTKIYLIDISIEQIEQKYVFDNIDNLLNLF